MFVVRMWRGGREWRLSASLLLLVCPRNASARAQGRVDGRAPTHRSPVGDVEVSDC